MVPALFRTSPEYFHSTFGQSCRSTVTVRLLQPFSGDSNGQLRWLEEPTYRLTSHRIGLATLHRLNYTFIII